MHSVCGATPREIFETMDKVVRLNYEAIYWINVDRDYQMHAFSETARIRVCTVDSYRGGGLV